LQQEFFEEDGIHLGRENGLVDAAEQLFLEPVHTGGPGEVFRAHFAKMDLEAVDHARQERLDLLGRLLVGDFESDLHLEVFRPVRRRREIDEHIRHVHEHRGMLLGHFRSLGGQAAEIEIAADTETEHRRSGGDHDDLLLAEVQLGLRLRLGAALAVIGTFRVRYIRHLGSQPDRVAAHRRPVLLRLGKEWLTLPFRRQFLPGHYCRAARIFSSFFRELYGFPLVNKRF
jgi:hypothetical protein